MCVCLFQYGRLAQNIIFINDLPTAHIFADETKVYRKFSSENDSAELQMDLQRLVEWYE